MKRAYILYGVLAGVLLLILQVFHYRMMIHDVRLELFAMVVAVIFLGLGVFVGFQFVKRKKDEHIVVGSVEHNLSERELEVLKLLTDGLSNQEIADQLFISLNTTKTHISNIYQKLRVSRRTQAIQKARNMGLIRSSESTI